MALSVDNSARAGAAAVGPARLASYLLLLLSPPGTVPAGESNSCSRWNAAQRAAERAQFSGPILRDRGTINPVFASNSAAAAP